MKAIAKGLALALLVAPLAWAQDWRNVDWGQAERAAGEVARHARLAFLAAAVRDDQDASRGLYHLWGDATVLRTLMGSAEGTRAQLPEALNHTGRDIRAARAAVRNADPEVQRHFRHVEQTYDRLKSVLAAGSGGDPAGVLGADIDISAWHGGRLDRHAILSGTVKGIDVTSADLLVTDRDGYTLWSRDDALPEIDRYYRRNPGARGRPVEIAFEVELHSATIPSGSHAVYLRLFDDHGNHEDVGVRLPR